jgi:LytS/YehU family sensor histidine kinase
MNIRLEARYKLLTTDILQSDKIPPLLFHTLIENGITHGNQSERESIFHLSGSYEGNRTVYTLSNSIPTAHQTAGVSENIKEGIGLKYVKTRLEELYPGRWKLDVSIIDDQWQVTITLWKKEI